MQNENSIKEHQTISIRRYFAFMFTIAIGILVSCFLFVVVNNWEQKDRRIKFESVVKGYANAVRNSLNGNVEALKFLGNFFDNSTSSLALLKLSTYEFKTKDFSQIT